MYVGVVVAGDVLAATVASCVLSTRVVDAAAVGRVVAEESLTAATAVLLTVAAVLLGTAVVVLTARSVGEDASVGVTVLAA